MCERGVEEHYLRHVRLRDVVVARIAHDWALDAATRAGQVG